MIYPTRAAVWATVAGIPLSLAVAVIAPAHWYAALGWPLAMVILAAIDALLGRAGVAATVAVPATTGVGEQVPADVAITVAGRAPRTVEVALSTNALIVAADGGEAVAATANGRAAARIALEPVRRGTGRVEALWIRWRGPIGLAWQQRVVPVAGSVAILPDVRPVREKGAQLFERHALQGLIAQLDRGDGTDFDTLVEYRSGMDRRRVDWKQSARHQKLFAKEYRSERNSQLVFAIDTGRQMSEPVAGLARIDRAIIAMLLAAWVALKLGDRVAVQAFDSRPRVASGFVSGTNGFPALQRVAAGIDYSAEESNYTFALTTLATTLTRRSMIVLFTEFTDQISSDFMVRAAARLVERHLLLVVVLTDEELAAIVAARPVSADDVTRAVTAAGLLADRRLALARLRHLGAHVVEAGHDAVGDALVAAYVDLKRRNLL